jgi:hypothetical protein
MATPLADPSIPTRPKPTREEGLALAARRKAARGRRTGRIRRAIAVIGVAAFIGPFAVIYTQLAEGRDPALANTQAVAAVVSTSTTTAASSSTASAAKAAAAKAAAAKKAASATKAAARKAAPAAVTTQQS